MLVRELMTTDLATLSPASSLKVALRTLAGRRVTAAPVVGADGSLVGIVSESDLVDGLLEPDPRVRLSRPVTRMPESSGVVVADVMSTPVLTVGPDDDVADALDRCARADVKSVPVVDGRGHVVGMVSRSDVVLLLSQSDAEVRAAVTDLLRDAGGRWQVQVRDGVVRLASSGTTSEDRTAAELLVSAVPGVLAVEHTEEIPS